MPKGKLSLKKIPPRTFGSMKGEEGHLPQMDLDDTQLPAIKDWKTGEMYYMVIGVKQTGSNIIEHGNRKGGIRNSFKVESVQDYTEEFKKSKS